MDRHGKRFSHDSMPELARDDRIGLAEQMNTSITEANNGSLPYL
jgi:hypothetical protein